MTRMIRLLLVNALVAGLVVAATAAPAAAVDQLVDGTVYLKLANVQGNADFSFSVGTGMVGFGTAPRIP